MGAGRGLLDVLFDLRCIGCQDPGTAWCERCVRAAWSPCVSSDATDRPVVSAAPYEKSVRRAVVAHKERGQLGLARPLGRLLALAVGYFPVAGAVVLVPCPSSAAALRERGQDHARRIAEQAAWSLRQGRRQVRVVSPLRLTGPVTDQVGLTVRQRQENRRNTIAARPASPAVGAVIIVDDVTTSGSTLAETGRALRAAGWPLLGSAVVARAGPHMGVAGAAGLG